MGGNKGGIILKIQQVDIRICHFEETVTFYEETLQFQLLSKSEREASFQIGESVLKLIRDEENHHYYYHFAFNIHGDLFKEAKVWLQERVELLVEDGDDEVAFNWMQSWSCYFEDPAGNIVEFIARSNASTVTREKGFSPKSVLGICEIGLSTDAIEDFAKELAAMGIKVREGDILHYHTYLNFMGEREGDAYILLGPVGRRWYFSQKLAIAAPVVIYTNHGVVRME